MATALNRLTTAEVRAFKEPGLYNDGAGLYLQVSRYGTKSWILRFKRQGRSRDMGLGSLSVVSLADARKRAKEARELLSRGVDPIEQRRQAFRANARSATFAECASDFIAAHEPSWKNAKHRQQWRNTIKAHTTRLGPLPVTEIDKADINAALAPLSATAPETARRVAQRVRRIIQWDKDGRPPPKAAQAKNHHAALPYDQLPAFLADLREREGVAVAVLEFLILTAARTGEAVGAQWSEIDFDKKLWTVPAERMKSKKEHRVPLSDRAIAILESLHDLRTGNLVFPGQRTGGPIGTAALWRLLRRMGRDDITTHGFRSSFRDWCAEQTAFPNDICEQALAHSVGNAVEAAYKRTDLLAKRRRLMDDWADYCSQPERGDAGKVVAIRGA